MTRQLDELYFDWLYALVCSDTKKSAKTHYKMLEQLFFKEFVWTIVNDVNRAEDGKELRSEFLAEQRLLGTDGFKHLGCSMFELLVALSRRLSFVTDGEPRYWFWVMIKNAGLYGYNDGMVLNVDRVDEILDRIIWRTYSPDGRGGLFPLGNNDGEDQRDIELWYQMSAYLLGIGAY